ncbi:MAG: hypothetical protein KIC60_05380 [Clostridium sp.]|nr:hypothetical protein [Clostridium sp.]
MKFYIRSFENSLKLPENYLKVIKKYAKNGNVNLIKDDYYEIAIIEIDSLEILPQFEKDIRETRGIIRSLDFVDIHGLIFNTLDEKEKIYQIDIYDSYNE